MKHVKLFESFQEKNIDSTCKKFGITNYTINTDGTVDVDGNVYLFDKGLSKLPLKFGEINGDFLCYGNKLINLERAPSRVSLVFDCSYNNLITLEGAPNYVGDNFWCDNNELISLEGGPKEVGLGFYCYNNELTTLVGSPKVIDGNFWCQGNKLITLEGGPSDISGEFDCEDNPIFQIYKLFPGHKCFMDSLDYGYIRGNKIVKRRLEESLEELGMEMPEFIPGYSWI